MMSRLVSCRCRGYGGSTGTIICVKELGLARRLVGLVPSPEHLQATFTVTSQGLARNKDSGPSLQIVVQSSKGRHQVYSQALMYREITLRLEYDKETGSNRIVWVQGQTAAPINLPANAGPLRLLLTVTVCQLGERCDTTITVK